MCFLVPKGQGGRGKMTVVPVYVQGNRLTPELGMPLAARTRDMFNLLFILFCFPKFHSKRVLGFSLGCGLVALHPGPHVGPGPRQVPVYVLHEWTFMIRKE